MDLTALYNQLINAGISPEQAAQIIASVQQNAAAGMNQQQIAQLISDAITDIGIPITKRLLAFIPGLEKIFGEKETTYESPTAAAQRESIQRLGERSAEQRAEADRAGAIAARDEQVQASGDVARAANTASQIARQNLGGAAGRGAAARVGAEAGARQAAETLPGAVQQARARKDTFEQKEVDRRALGFATGQEAVAEKATYAADQQAYLDFLQRNRAAQGLVNRGRNAANTAVAKSTADVSNAVAPQNIATGPGTQVSAQAYDTYAARASAGSAPATPGEGAPGTYKAGAKGANVRKEPTRDASNTANATVLAYIVPGTDVRVIGSRTNRFLPITTTVDGAWVNGWIQEDLLVPSTAGASIGTGG